ncbi:hypothetical protein ABES21_18900 [Peribacillus frigoritolerans]
MRSPRLIHHTTGSSCIGSGKYNCVEARCKTPLIACKIAGIFSEAGLPAGFPEYGLRVWAGNRSIPFGG